MNFIDISNWQKGLDLEALFNKNEPLHGAIVKATGGVSYVNPCCDPWVQELMRLKRPWGFYHYLDDDFKESAPEAEAEFFVKNTRNYFGHGLPAIDYEGAGPLSFGTSYLKRVLDKVFELTGVKPLVYCSLSVVQSQDFSAIASAGYSLWVAQYADNNPTYIQENPWQRGSVSPFSKYVMHQYSSHGQLSGWNGNLDLNKFYGELSDWNKLVEGKSDIKPHKTVDPQVISDVMDGKYGIGAMRRMALTLAGYNYDEVQGKINELFGYADNIRNLKTRIGEYWDVFIQKIV